MNPTLVDVVKEAVRRGTSTLRVSMPGRIESFDPVTQLAKVKPLIQNQHTKDDGSVVYESLPVVVNVPVMLPYTNAGITFPVTPGTQCLLVFADRSIDGWYESGTEQRDAEARQHHLTDGIAIVGLHHAGNKIADYDNSRIAIGADGGVKVAVTSADVQLGVAHNGVATEAAIKGSTYTSDETAMLQSVAASLNTAAGALQTAGVALNAVAPGVGLTLNSAAAAVQAAASSMNTFASGQASRLSVKVKLV